jgi:hypothetical protein
MVKRLRITRPQEKVIERKLRKHDFPNFPEYLNYLYSQHIPDDWPLKIYGKGSLLRRSRIVQAQRDTQEKSEFNITALFLPERFKLTPYYETLPSEMNEKQKALAVRWWLERKDDSQDGFNPITKRIASPRTFSHRPLCHTIYCYYGRLNKHETYMIIAILYSLWDNYDGHYDNVVSSTKDFFLQGEKWIKLYSVW